MQEKKRVLIVDDDPGILVQLRWALREEFDLLLAGTADEAGELLRGQSPPAVALVDLHLPPDAGCIEGGLELIRSLRRSTAEIRILAFTARFDAESDRRCRSAGAEKLLGKPLAREQLLRLLRETDRGNGR